MRSFYLTTLIKKTSFAYHVDDIQEAKEHTAVTLHGDELRLCDLKQNGNLERAQRRRDIRLWPSQASQPARAGQRCSLHRTDCAKNSEFDDGESAVC